MTPAKRGKKPDKSEVPDTGWGDKSPAQRQRVMTWMQRLKRVFNIDIVGCEHCGGHVKAYTGCFTVAGGATYIQ